MENVIIVSTADLSTLRTGAENFARLEGSRDAILREVCRVIGAEPTFEQWEACRLAVFEGYRVTKPQATDDACRKFFSRMIEAARRYAADEGFEFPKEPTKPKAENAEAARKRESRANPFKDKTSAELKTELEKIKVDVQSATDAVALAEKAKVYTQALDALRKAENAEAKAAGKAAADALKPRRDAIAKTLKDADATTLALIESTLATRDPARARSAWALILAACPQEIRLAELSVAMRGSEPQKPKRGRKDSVTA